MRRDFSSIENDILSWFSHQNVRRISTQLEPTQRHSDGCKPHPKIGCGSKAKQQQKGGLPERREKLHKFSHFCFFDLLCDHKIGNNSPEWSEQCECSICRKCVKRVRNFRFKRKLQKGAITNVRQNCQKGRRRQVKVEFFLEKSWHYR